MRLPFLLTRRRCEQLLSDQARGFELAIRKIGENNRADFAAEQAQHNLVAEQLADTSIVNECLTHDLLVSRRQRVIARKAGARILAAYLAEKRRADLLQQRLDDACGLTDSRVEDGRHWQQRRDDKRGLSKEATS